MIDLLTLANLFLAFSALYPLFVLFALIGVCLSSSSNYPFIIFIVLVIGFFFMKHLIPIVSCYVYTDEFPTLDYNFCLEHSYEVGNVIDENKKEIEEKDNLKKELERKELKQNITKIIYGVD